MKYSKSYKFVIGKREESVSLKSSDGLSAIAAVDTSSLNGSMYEIVKSENISDNSYIKLAKKTARGIELESTTPEVLITDINDKEGNPLYYKSIIRKSGYTSILVDGVDAGFYDSTFFYSKNKGKVEYLYNDGTKEEDIGEFYPVYVNNSDASYRFVRDIDGKFFNIRYNGRRFIISVQNTEISYKIKDPENSRPIIRQYDNNEHQFINIYVNPYNFTRKLFSDGKEITLKYFAGFPVQSVVRIENSLCDVKSGIIYLRKSNIFDHDILITVVDSVGSPIHSLDKNSVDFKNSYLKSGIISIPNIEEYLADGNKVLASFNYVQYDENNISIDSTLVGNFDYISVGILPSEVVIDGNSLAFGNHIKYYAFDSLGNSILEDGKDVGAAFIRVVGYGFSERGYAENGYSGYIESGEYNIEGVPNGALRTKEAEYPKTGYGEDFYSSGPYGGTIVSNKNSLENVMLSNGSTTGYIEICRVYKKQILSENVVLNNRLSLPRPGTHGLRKIETLNNSICRLIAGEYKAPSLNASVISIDAFNSTNASLSVYSKDLVNTTLKISYSEDASKKFDKKVENETMLRFAKPFNTLSKTDHSQYKLKGEIDGGWEYIEGAVYKHIEGELSVFVRVANSVLDNYTRIGVVYGNSNPSRSIEV